MSGNQSKLICLIPLLFVFFWSTGFIGAKYALPFIEPFYLLFLRFTLTVGVFLLLCLAFKVKWPSLRLTGHQMVAGLLIHGAYLGGVFAAIKLGMPAGIAAIIVGVQPVLTALLSWQFMGVQLRFIQWLGLSVYHCLESQSVRSTKNASAWVWIYWRGHSGNTSARLF